MQMANLMTRCPALSATSAGIDDPTLEAPLVIKFCIACALPSASLNLSLDLRIPSPILFTTTFSPPELATFPAFAASLKKLAACTAILPLKSPVTNPIGEAPRMYKKSKK